LCPPGPKTPLIDVSPVREERVASSRLGTLYEVANWSSWVWDKLSAAATTLDGRSKPYLTEAIGCASRSGSCLYVT